MPTNILSRSIKSLRYCLGVYLLRPQLQAEHEIARIKHEQAGQGPLERYWWGRLTTIHRIFYGGRLGEFSERVCPRCEGRGRTQRPADGKDEMGLPRWGPAELDNRVDQTEICPRCRGSKLITE